MNKIIDFYINKCREQSDKVKEIEELCKNRMPISMEDVDILLENLSYQVRKRIADYEGKDMDHYSYYYKCDLAQSMINYYLQGLCIPANPINTNEVMNGVCGHSLTVATIKTTEGEKVYLIDPTYIQFFEKEKCDSSRFVIINNQVCIAPDPGFFVVKSNSTNTLLPLLTNGYIEFNDEVAKAYGDSFFQTKQGTAPDQIKYNVASGSSYIKWFQKYTSTLSKSEEELKELGLFLQSEEDKKISHL